MAGTWTSGGTGRPDPRQPPPPGPPRPNRGKTWRQGHPNSLPLFLLPWPGGAEAGSKARSRQACEESNSFNLLNHRGTSRSARLRAEAFGGGPVRLWQAGGTEGKRKFRHKGAKARKTHPEHGDQRQAAPAGRASIARPKVSHSPKHGTSLNQGGPAILPGNDRGARPRRPEKIS